MRERAIKCDTDIGRPIVVFQPFPTYNYVQLLVNSSIVQVEGTRHSIGHTRLQSPAFTQSSTLASPVTSKDRRGLVNILKN